MPTTGLPTVTIDPALTRLAQAQAEVMAKRDKLDHGAGKPFVERLKASGYDAKRAAENISAGYHTLAEAFSGWRELKSTPRQYAFGGCHPHGHCSGLYAGIEIQGLLGADHRRARRQERLDECGHDKTTSANGFGWDCERDDSATRVSGRRRELCLKSKRDVGFSARASKPPFGAIFGMTTVSDPLTNLLGPERLTAVVDIGANPIDTEPPYKRMLASRLCTLVGFEPQAEGLAKLNAMKSDLETYLPYAVGDGSRGILKVCHAPGMTSLLTPERRVLDCFPGFTQFGQVNQEIPIETRTLDSISEIKHLDFLKIDVQGGELAVFRNGSARLSKAIAVQSEISFVTLYKDEPVFGEIDLALRALGFIPHMFEKISKRMILPLHFGDNLYASMNQMLEADIVYVRDFTQPEKMSPEQLKHLALVAHHCYGSYDLTARCVHFLAAQGAAAPDALAQYLAILGKH